MFAAAQALATAVTLSRLSTGRRRRRPLTARPDPPPTSAPDPPPDPPGDAPSAPPTVSIVVPARNEAARIGPCLDGLLADPALAEVLVVDDGSEDGTAELAAARGARVIAAGAPPAGWVGKPWALQRGLEEARGEVVVSVDADTRPRPGLGRALAKMLNGAEFVSAGARFVCDTAGERWLHPALLATLVYRFGPLDATAPPPPSRLVISGQCTAVRRADLLEAGGYRPAAGHLSDDAALARDLAGRGWRIVFVDAGALITVDMHDSIGDTWREWGRTIALGDVTPPLALATDLAVVWLVLGLPPLRLVARRAGRLDFALLSLRMAMTAALAPAYARRGAPYWLSPLADPAAAVRLTLSVLRPPHRWRGRDYPVGRGTAPR